MQDNQIQPFNTKINATKNHEMQCPKCGNFMEYDKKIKMFHCIMCGKIVFEEDDLNKKIKCLICGKLIERGRGNKKYCYKCAYELLLERMRKLYKRKKHGNNKSF